MTPSGEVGYYLKIRSRMLREFRAMFKGTRQALSRHFDDQKIAALEAESLAEYNDLLPDLPYIGGRKNEGTINIIMGAIVLAIIRPLEKEELTQREIGEIIYGAFDHYFKARPRLLQLTLGKLAQSGFFIKRLKKQIIDSSRREFEGDFVMELVEPSGGDFDFGYNYTQCALHRLFAEHKAGDYLRYVCLGDYALFRSLGIGFSRGQTIANGAPICDFRFIRQAETVQGWPPENLEEWTG